MRADARPGDVEGAQVRRQPRQRREEGVRLGGAGLEAVAEAVAGVAGEVRVRGGRARGCKGRGDVWLAVEVGEERGEGAGVGVGVAGRGW